MSDEYDKSIQKLYDEVDSFIREYDAGYWELTSKAQEIGYDDYTSDGKKKAFSLADLLPNAILKYKFDLDENDPLKIRYAKNVIKWKTRARSHNVLIPSQNKISELNDQLTKEQEEHKKCVDRVRFLEGEVDRLDRELADAKARGFIPTGTWKVDNT